MNQKDFQKIIRTMSSHEFLWAILLNNSEEYFKEEALERALRDILPQHSRLYRGLFYPRPTGTPESGTGFDSTLTILRATRMAAYREAWQYMSLTDLGRDGLEELLRERYKQRDIVRELRPFAQTVWEKASEYRH